MQRARQNGNPRPWLSVRSHNWGLWLVWLVMWVTGVAGAYVHCACRSVHDVILARGHKIVAVGKRTTRQTGGRLCKRDRRSDINLRGKEKKKAG